MITAAISEMAVKCLNATGYPGAGMLMALESMVAPVPSEAVMPFVGFLVADGKWNIYWSIGATSLGSLVGSLISYLMGYYGGKPLVLRAGKYLLLNPHDLELTERFFHRRAGVITLFIGRFIPVVRHFISIPAVTGRMPLAPFLAATLLGATLWNTFLLRCGMVLRDHWEKVLKYSHQVDYGVAALLVIGAGLFIYSRKKRAGAAPPGTAVEK